MKRLYLIEARYYVMAEDRIEARHIIPDSISASIIFVSEVDKVDADWLDAIPYGGDNDKVCGEIIQEIPG